MTDLSSAPVPPVGDDDHVRGDGPAAILYLDLGCPHCAAAWREISALEVRLCVRHFPVASKHRRAPALHAAAEAAAAQREDAFWAMVDAIYGDLGHQDDPHLWERARAFGLDLERFERDRRSPGIEARVRRDFESGIRGGVATTPTAFRDGRLIPPANIAAELLRDRSEKQGSPPTANPEGREEN
jgi:protein-disulfide isomerase